MRLIDADSMKADLLTVDPRYEGMIQWCITVLDAQPTIERKMGKWICMSDLDGIYWTCSECGEDIPRVAHFDPQFDLFPRLESIDKTYFCPNCGARMEI